VVDGASFDQQGALYGPLTPVNIGRKSHHPSRQRMIGATLTQTDPWTTSQQTNPEVIEVDQLPRKII